MTRERIKEIIREIEKEYEIGFSEYQEEVRQGKVVSISYTMKFKVD